MEKLTQQRVTCHHRGHDPCAKSICSWGRGVYSSYMGTLLIGTVHDDQRQ